MSVKEIADYLTDNSVIISITGVNKNDTTLSVLYEGLSGGKVFFGNDRNASNCKGNFLKQMANSNNGGQLNYGGMKLIWNFPDATGDLSVSCMGGHIVAPNANVIVSGGNFEGGIIANCITDNGAEAHFYSYYKVGDETPVKTTTTTTTTTTNQSETSSTTSSTTTTSQSETSSTTSSTTTTTTSSTTSSTTTTTTTTTSQSETNSTTSSTATTTTTNQSGTDSTTTTATTQAVPVITTASTAPTVITATTASTAATATTKSSDTTVNSTSSVDKTTTGTTTTGTTTAGTTIAVKTTVQATTDPDKSATTVETTDPDTIKGTTLATEINTTLQDTTTAVYTTVTSFVPEQTSTAPKDGTVVGYYENPSDNPSTVEIEIPKEYRDGNFNYYIVTSDGKRIDPEEITTDSIKVTVDGGEEFMLVCDDPNPLGAAEALPKTGKIPANYYFILGGILMIGGYVFINKKKLFGKENQ